ncbi:type II toxin-antitoxin system RelE/ParE family toxin [Achromobacter arsenitoxydans]|uniref:type II toxin-antitoxin system RelE/ParE family toxin n=1 Tax=Achromobacter arsenitoxydans TaxID=1147684 RepID=UPI0009DA0E6A|nr:type II toxin-antitoxin system RelE/ParE family toxin [Achromobacter arsenitoxydans]
MSQVIVEPAAEQDLDALWDSNDPAKQDAVALIEATLAEIAADSDFLSRMFRYHQTRVGDPTVEADRLVEFWNDRTAPRNLSRLKMWHFPEDGGHLCSYRVVYAYDGRSEAYHVLGVIHRSNTNYDRKHPHIARILRDYDDLGIP